MAAVAENATGVGDQFVRRPSSSLPQQKRGGSSEAEYQRDVRELVELLSKLNPSAKEFIPSSNASANTPLLAAGQDADAAAAAAQTTAGGRMPNGRLSADAPVFVASSDYYGRPIGGGNRYAASGDGPSNNQQPRRRKNNYNKGHRRFNDRVQKAQKEDRIRRTVYVSYIDHNVTEEQLAALFGSYGKVLDCRICCDANSVLRFAFIEFVNEHGARAALNLDGTVLGYYPLRVLPSKTAILPVNPTLLPQSEDEREMCSRTVYCTNIDKKVTQTDLKEFFQSCCGEVSRLRLLGDNVHSTRIAFVEFVQAESALRALNCSGMVLGSLPIRLSPSKTPVRPRVARTMQ
ncbi:polyadenylate-binding protein-interacting protein 9-like [Phoenix dactylifera]|uniref:Polyadenylate-binding protein-interacting protein 9-like n=1 Tax=Phoenix dactylifera TaxID=42345 RepID=A0A8B9ALD8_PHODC|nr:polyadenylate-binding protein-interacting protein 9-like [Phoenix dactylifera]XP_008793006.1 polyadenylate-binding protein-interacting protein 9-like [Phoenix dactylifera]XP_038987546.1 polyadenylate-binding protein-interacting protein 9-like [Phoenix dactylifera]